MGGDNSMIDEDVKDEIQRAIARQQRAIETANRQLVVLNNILRSLQGEIEVLCLGNVFGKGCGKATKINQLEYIQTVHYVRPYSCNSGDYYKPGEGLFICPHCGHTNRLYDRPEIEKLRMSFKSIREERD